MNDIDPPSLELSALCIFSPPVAISNISVASISTVNLDSDAVSIISAFESPSKILSVEKPDVIVLLSTNSNPLAPEFTATSLPP